MTTIKLVKDDTGPDIDVQLTDGTTGLPINVSNAGDVVKFYFRAVGSSVLKASITCTKPNGGADGVVRISWPALALDTVGEFEGEFEITFNSGMKQTVYDLVNFTIRDDLSD